MKGQRNRANTYSSVAMDDDFVWKTGDNYNNRRNQCNANRCSQYDVNRHNQYNNNRRNQYNNNRHNHETVHD